MDEKTKELVAIGASVGANCMPCLAFHIEKARSLGATNKELITASKIGFHVKAGATEKMETYAVDLIKGFTEEHVEDVCRGD